MTASATLVVPAEGGDVDDRPDHYFRISPASKWHRGLGKAAWCNSRLSNRVPTVEWETLRPGRNLCARCFPKERDR